MKKYIVLLLSLFLALASPAEAKRLAVINITTAVTAQTTTPLQFGRLPIAGAMAIQINFGYGSGGTTAKAWVQTSLDGGATWNDVAAGSFTTASSRLIFNVSSLTPVFGATGIVLTDGTLASGAIDGLVGPLWRVKFTTTGTYAGGTQLLVDINGAQFTP